MGPGTGRTSLRPPPPPAPPAACATCRPAPARRPRGDVGASGSVEGDTAKGEAHAWAASRGGAEDPNRARVLGAQASGSATANRRQVSVEGQATVAGAQLRGSRTDARGNNVSGEVDILSAQANGRAGATAYGRGAQGQASATMARMQASATRVTAAGSETAQVEGKVMSAAVRGDALLGDDGRRVGIALGGKAEASAASIAATTRRTYNIPFTNWSIGTEATVEASAGTGIGGGAYAYMDRADGRYRAGVFGKLAAIAGIEIDREISIGPRTPPTPPGR